MNDVVPVSAAVARWSARLLSAAILLFWGFFVVAHLIGEQGRSDRPLAWKDYLILATMGGSLVGLALAWKWELTGAAITLVAVLMCAAVNWKVLLFPGTLIPLAAVLYLSAWWLYRGPREDQAARRPTG